MWVLYNGKICYMEEMYNNTCIIADKSGLTKVSKNDVEKIEIPKFNVGEPCIVLFNDIPKFGKVIEYREELTLTPYRVEFENDTRLVTPWELRHLEL